VPAREQQPVAAVEADVGGRLAAPALGAAHGVHRLQVVADEQLPAQGRAAHAEVDVLPVEEVVLVEAAELPPQVAVHGQAGPRQPRVQLRAGQHARAPGAARAQRHLGAGEPRAPVVVQDARGHQGPRPLQHLVVQGGGGRRVQRRVRVEQQQRRAPQREGPLRARVGARPEARVGGHRDELEAALVAQRLHLAAGRGGGPVVDDHQHGRDPREVVAQDVLLQQAGGAVVHDDDAQPRGCRAHRGGRPAAVSTAVATSAR